MTPEELKSLLENIVAEASSVADIAAGVAPPLLPYIVIGKAIGAAVPGLVAGVDSWIQGNPPTQAEKDELADKLKVLANPDLP